MSFFMSHGDNNPRPAPWTALLLLLVAVLAVHAIDSDRQSIILGGARNAGHIPLFMLVTFVVSRFLRGHTLKTVTTVAVIALSSEISQLVTGGETDWRDLVADIAGAGLMLAAMALWQGNLKAARLGAVGLVLIGLAPLCGWLYAWHQRSDAMPCLARFDASSLSPAQRPMNASITARSETMLSLSLEPKRYAGLRLLDPVADWSDYDRLTIDFATAPPVPITVRIHDRDHNNEHEDRFNKRFDAGRANVTIPLDQIRKAPAGRRMDLTRIEELTFFTSNPPPGTVLEVSVPCLQRETG